MSEVFDPTPCSLGEGPFWHPVREQLFWFDINQFQLLTREGGETRVIQFDEHVSAAGWISDDALLIATETRLIHFEIDSEWFEDVEGLEPDTFQTRSNDGRTDPWGGFWIGTMAKDGAGQAGAIYRYFDGKLTKLFPDLTIPNAICFSPDRKFAYFADTPTQKIMRQKLEADRGFPDGEPEVFVDLGPENLFPDGAVVDTEGNLWNALYGAGRVSVFAPDGTLQRNIAMGASQTTCPAFGGPGRSTLFCTSAKQRLDADGLATSPHHGMTFQVPEAGHGQDEHQFKL